MIPPTSSPTAMSGLLLCTHIATRTSIRLISSNAKGAMGLVRCPYVLADEPGSHGKYQWRHSHASTQFKRRWGSLGSPLKAIYTGHIGT